MTNPATKLYTVASGKGGVGKTSLTLNLAAQLAKLRHKVLVIDGDTGLANADVQLNIQPQKDLADVLSGTPVGQALIHTAHGFMLLAGRAGHPGLAALSQPQFEELWSNLTPELAGFSHVLIDAAAGVSPLTLSLCARAHATLLITTPDPASFTDAYALMKLQHRNHGSYNARLIVNQATQTEAKHVHKRLNTALEAFLNLPPLTLLGQLPPDRLFASSVRHHQLASLSYPQAPAVAAVTAIAKQL